jgi:hypothetical protein
MLLNGRPKGIDKLERVIYEYTKIARYRLRGQIN